MHRIAVLSFFGFFASLALPSAAAEPGEPYAVRDIDLTGEAFYEPCFLAPCVPPTPIYGSMIEQLTPLGDLLVFVANDRVHGYEPWVSDGTEAGTRMLADTCPGPCADLEPRVLGVLDGRVYVAIATVGAYGGVWVTDGTPEGSRIMDELCPELCGELLEPIDPSRPLGDGVLLAVAGSIPGLWRLDDPLAEPVLVTHVGGDYVSHLTAAGGRVYFVRRDDDGVYEDLWVSDGTAAGTRVHADIAPGPASSEPGSGGRFVPGFARAGGLLFFPAFHPDTDVELWALDLGVEDEEPPPPPLPPPPPSMEWLESPEVPGFRVQVRISAAGSSILGNDEPACIPETLCVSGALPGRSEVFVRVVEPKPNGFLWPTLVKLSTSTVEIWVEQTSTEQVRDYVLEGASPGFDVLPGLFDRMGFLP